MPGAVDYVVYPLRTSWKAFGIAFRMSVTMRSLNYVLGLQAMFDDKSSDGLLRCGTESRAGAHSIVFIVPPRRVRYVVF